ncbi:MAG: sodium:solute symporter [Ktedonobacteraceae bacterium]
MIDWVALSVFIFFFLLVTVLGFVAARWRRGDLNTLDEWGLAGRRFGTIITWFLLGGDLYTAYTFVAVPGLVYAIGAQGFYAVPYTILVYPLIFILMPKFWSVCKKYGYMTPSDFVEGRYGSKTLALVVALTGIMATMPYIALQMFGIAVSVAQMGINPEIALIVAFVILAAYTYFSGLRAPALIALVKDTMIFIVLFAVIIAIPISLGGFGKIFAAAQAKGVAATAAAAAASLKTHTTVAPAFHFTLSSAQFLPYTTLALGSALALFLYPHSLTGTLSSNSRSVVKRNAALLPIYSMMLGLLALLGYMAIAAHVTPLKAYGSNGIVPALIAKEFPSWFAGFAFAAISIGALVPASIMSIAAANLFTRNIYKPYIRPNYSAREETTVARITSLVVKLGALLFILLIPATFIINFQLLGGIIIIQTLPAVFLGLFTRWLNRWALVIGWAVGIVSGVYMFVAANYSSVYTFAIGGQKYGIYSALSSVVLNLVLAVILTPVFTAVGLKSGKDQTHSVDYTEDMVETKEAMPEALG